MLDTLKYAKRLRESGLPQEQAEAHADALWEAIEDTVATKQDIQLLRTETKQDIQLLRTETKQDLEVVRKDIEGRLRLLYWMVGFNLALTVAVLVRLFLR